MRRSGETKAGLPVEENDATPPTPGTAPTRVATPSTTARKAGSSTVRAWSCTVTRAVVGNWLAKRCSRSRCTARDWEPGTSNPPEPSRSVSPEAKLAMTASSTTQAPMTYHRRLTVKLPSRPSRLFMSPPPTPAGTDRLVSFMDPMCVVGWCHR